MLPVVSLLVIGSVLTSLTEANNDNRCPLARPCSVQYKTLGCFRDQESGRALPNYIMTDRDPALNISSGIKINWENWDYYLADFSCRCAQKAKELGYDIFGMQFYGECWAGKKAENDHAQYGELYSNSDEQTCVGKAYAKCGDFERYCSGIQYTNFVYEIVESSCDLSFERVGCFNDNHNANARPLGDYLYNERDPSTSNYGGKSIDWRNYDVFLKQFACTCARKAQESGSTFFGVQFYGECWASSNGENTFAIDGTPDPKKVQSCVDGCYKDCGGQKDKICAGTQHQNYVYRLNTCNSPVESIGCFTESTSNRALSVKLKDTTPGSPFFFGSTLIPSMWNQTFPDFLCMCAQIAKGRGWTYFGVSNGACYSGANSANTYNNHGSSQSCRRGTDSQTCASGSKLCSGLDDSSMYVYKIPQSSSKRSIQPPFIPVRDSSFRKKFLTKN